MRRAKSLRIGVHHANAVVWEPVYRTHLVPGGVRVVPSVVALVLVRVLDATPRELAAASVPPLRARLPAAVASPSGSSPSCLSPPAAPGRSVRAIVGVESKGVRWS